MIQRCKRLAIQILADDGGQAQVPDLIKLAAVALPILIGLVALYKYYGQQTTTLSQQATPDTQQITAP